MERVRHTFGKEERLCSKKLTESLFSGEGKAISSFPLRMVYRLYDKTELEQSQVLISVSKRRFKHAVDRNRVKRQIRESWRLQSPFSNLQLPENKNIAAAIIWISDELQTSELIASKLAALLKQLQHKLDNPSTNEETP